MNPLLRLMHDTAGKNALIGGNIFLYEKKLMDKDEIDKLLSDIKRWNKDIMDIIDKFYVENKDKFK